LGERKRKDEKENDEKRKKWRIALYYKASPHDEQTFSPLSLDIARHKQS